VSRLAHQRSPGDGRRHRGEDRVARQAPALLKQQVEEDRLGAAVSHRAQHRLGVRILGLVIASHE
jgi:hypothetical protein